jgi:biofilm PGA synthesis lipoprotein PgaB
MNLNYGLLKRCILPTRRKAAMKNRQRFGQILAIEVLILLFHFVAVCAARPGVVALVYQDIGRPVNVWTVATADLARQFAYLEHHGYHPITMRQFEDACQGRCSLPDKAVLLTFDGGHLSFYQKVFPLLKAYHYPAVLSVVTSWENGRKPEDVGKLMSWDEIREVERSGLVTIASNSDNLHHYVVTDSWGDEQAAASSRIYFPAQGYEGLAAYRRRIDADMEKTQKIFLRELGHRAGIYVWPYGAYTQIALKLAQRRGFAAFLTLESGINEVKAAAPLTVKRAVVDGRDPEGFSGLLQNGGVQNRPLHVGQIDLDYIYDKNPRQMKRNIDTTIRYLEHCGVNTVFLEAHVDDSGSGNIKQVYFFNHEVPIKADVFEHVAACLHHAGFKVYAWMNTLAGPWAFYHHPEDAVTAFQPKKLGWYKRGSPFSRRIWGKMKRLLGDLAAYEDIDGFAFNDDLYLNNFEDNSPAAQRAFNQRFGRKLTPGALKNPALLQAWTKMKTDQLNAFSLAMAGEMKKYRPDMAIVRTIYAPLILKKKSEEWFAENYRDDLNLYNYTLIMAYPRMEKAKHPNKWLKTLVYKALAFPQARNRAIFELQAYDWNHSVWINPNDLKRQIMILKKAGAINLGFCPLNVVDYSAKPVSF